MTSHELGEVAEALVQTLAWSPHDYVDGLSRTGDKRLVATRLCRDLPSDDDFRFVHSGGVEGDVAVLAERLRWDSEFFGFRVARLGAVVPLSGRQVPDDPTARDAVRELVRRARTAGIAYLIASVDARDLATLRALATSQFVLIETRLHFHRSLRGYDAGERFAIRRATPGDLPGLEEAAVSMVNPYDRFHSDPFIRPEVADRLMVRWVRESVVGGFADETWVPDSPLPLAFCTTKRHQPDWGTWGVRLVQPVVLGAVAPPFKGWYRKLISEICFRLADEGAEHAYFVTQSANAAAIRTVERLGFRLGRAEHTLRLVLTEE